MKVSEHVAYGAIASTGLFYWFGWNSLYFFIGSVAIDLDHYAEFLYYQRFSNWSVKSMFKWYGALTKVINNTDYMVLHAYHTIEFLLILLVMIGYYNSRELSLLWLGLVFHITLDRIRMHQNGFLNIRANSFLEYWLRKKELERLGLPHPEYVFKVFTSYHLRNGN